VKTPALLLWGPSSLAFASFSVAHFWYQYFWPINVVTTLCVFALASAAATEFQSRHYSKPASSDGLDTCLITGGTKGIGLSLAKCFARDRYNLILVSRHDRDLQDAREKLLQINPNITVILIAKDLYKERGADELFEEVNSTNATIRDRHLRVNHIINNIGLCQRGDFLELPLIDQLGMIQLNIMNAVKLTYLFGNVFKQKIESNPNSKEQFRFMMTASFAALIVCPFLSVYSGTKAFVHSFSVSFNEELKAPKYRGRITSTSLCPGYTLTASLPPAGIQHTTALAMKNHDDPDRVGYGGYRAMMEGKPYVLIGILNNLTYWITSTILPVAWTAKLGKFFNSDWEDLTPGKIAEQGLQAKRGWEEGQPASDHLRSALAEQ
jgi:short-subunit dehydrogenase